MKNKRKKPASKSPTQRSLALLRSQGYTVAIVEKWNPFCHIRQDMFGFIDLLAIRGIETIGIQTTTRNNFIARMNKIAAHENYPLWVSPGFRRLVIHGWGKTGGRGQKKQWTCRKVEMLALGGWKEITSYGDLIC